MTTDMYHGGEALARALHAEGFTHVFGIPGGEYVSFLEALDRLNPELGINYINVRHEQAAAHMADAFARVSGRPAACCGTVGPGFLNLIPGLAPAAWDNVPVLAIHPQQGPKFEGHHRLQGGLDQLAMLKPVVKYQVHESDPNRIIRAAQKCFKQLFSGCPGVVQLEISEDAFHAIVDDYGRVVDPPARYRCTAPPAGNPSLVDQAAALLAGAKKPLIVSGGGVAASGAWPALQAFSLEHGIPVITTMMGIGTMSTNHETYIGATLANSAVMKAAREADAFLLLGTKLSYVMGYGKSPLWNNDASVVQVDIDPAMIGKNRPVDVGIVGDAGVVLWQLAAAFSKHQHSWDVGWLPSLRQDRQAAIDGAKGKMTSSKVPIDPRRVIADLTAFMNPEDILCIDGGDIAVLAIGDVDAMKPRAPRTVLQSIGLGHLGTCIPYAIGAKMAKPGARVFAITGDGSFLFNVQELDTAIKYCTPFVIVIADNCKWGMIENNQKSKWKKRDRFCVDICSDYVQIAKGFGCHAERVEDPAELTPALQRAVDANRPAIIQVPIKFVTPPSGSLLMAFKDMKF